MKKEVFKVEGMTCAACSAAVERVTGRLPGMKEASVNLVAGRLTVIYDETLTNRETICAKVEKAGFSVSPYMDSKKLREEAAKKTLREQKQALHRVIAAICFSVPLLYLSMGHMLPIPLPLPKTLNPTDTPLFFAVCQLVLTIPVLFLGRVYYITGIKALFSGNPNMDTLVALGTSSAFLYSLYQTFQIQKVEMAVHHLYYESAAVVLTLIMLGKYMEQKSKGKTSDAISALLSLAPKKASLLTPEGEKEIDAELLCKGDIFLVRPGESIPADSIVTDGSSAVNEAMLTGESIPVEKNIGDKLIGGSVNFNGMLTAKVTETGDHATLSKIVRLMEEAQEKKAPIARLSDRVSRYFVPVVMAIALLAGILWLIITKDFSFSLRIFVSVLVIACPCALGLATPTAIMVGTGLGATHGILVKSGEALEAASHIKTVILDKTGTITEGKPVVTDTILVDGTGEKKRLLSFAYAAEIFSEHPLAGAVVSYCEEQFPAEALVEWKTNSTNFLSTTGRGVSVSLSGTNAYVGSLTFLEEQGFLVEEAKKKAETLYLKGQTVLAVGISGEHELLLLALSDQIKPTSKEAILKIRKMGIHVCMLTGDNKKAAEAIGREAMVDEIISEVLPEDKARIVTERRTFGKVMMVGDGINDAPALAAADCGVAIGSGSDIAVESASVVLIRSDLLDCYRAILLGRLTLRNIRQNLFWAFFYNTIGIPVAAGLLYPATGLLLSPMLGGFAMSLSSVFVVGNALRLRTKRL